MRLEDAVGVDLRGRDGLDDRLEQRLEVRVVRCLAVGGLVERGRTDLRSGEDDGDVEDGVDVEVGHLIGEVGGEAEEQVLRVLDDAVDARIGAVGLVDDEDDGQLRGECLAEDEARLRQRSLGGVDEEDDAVDHGQSAFDLAAEVGVARGVDDVDDDRFVAGGGSVVEHRGVLREDRDPLLPLEVAGVHHAIGEVTVLVEHTGLPEHGVDQGGLAVVDVRNDGHVAAVVTAHGSFCHG